MLKMGNKKIIMLTLLFILYACNENKLPKKENKPITRDVLLPKKISYYGKGTVDSTVLKYTNIDIDHQIVLYSSITVDSIVLEYTDIDSITQFVNRIFFSKAFNKPDTIKYKLINDKAKAYIELIDHKIRSVYLDTEISDGIWRNFKNLETPRLEGNFQYINCLKDSMDITYYVFKGNDIAFIWTFDGYFYFDSIFHLKKIYNKDVLLYSVN